MGRLSDEDRAFLATLEEVVYSNPFSETRDASIRRLLPDLANADLTAQRDALARAVGPRLERFADPALARALPAQQRRLVESGWLYVCYQRHVPEIDAHIARQAGVLEPLETARLADAIMGELIGHGIEEAQALRYFEFFFQLRRAFFFLVGSLPGHCPSMKRLRQALWNNVFTFDMRSYERRLRERLEDFSTLLLGETGTGKGQAAAAIGRSAFIPYRPDLRRFAVSFSATFVSINLSQFPETLIESELFGHRKGAFTGAVDHHEGLLERCSSHGALFLDEIGEVSIPVQIKLLQVLQERTFSRVGSHDRMRFAGRVIAATNRPLADLRAGGRFREDFYYRLCSDVIVLPTLRKRLEESPGELDELVALLASRIGSEQSADAAGHVLEILRRDVPEDYAWPGNVRELEQAVRRILLTGAYRPDQPVVPQDEEDLLCAALRAGSLPSDELMARYCGLLYAKVKTLSGVAERTGLDRRTVRRLVERSLSARSEESGKKANSG